MANPEVLWYRRHNNNRKTPASIVTTVNKTLDMTFSKLPHSAQHEQIYPNCVYPTLAEIFS